MENLLSLTDDGKYLQNLTLNKSMRQNNPLLYGILAAVSFVIVFIIMLWILQFAWNNSLSKVAPTSVKELNIVSAFWLVIAVRILFHYNLFLTTIYF
jgi:heme/copper-type cytochrome/quinol oxidase subunit 2